MLSPSRLLVAVCLAWLTATVDAATYRFDDNAPYHWEQATTDVVWDRTSTSYPVDDDKAVVNIGFSFPFGNSSYSQVRILSNGILQFGADQALHRDYENENLPNSDGDRAIYVYWDDLDPSRGGSVRYGLHGSAPHRYFVVSWENLPNYRYDGVFNLQVILYEDGEIKTQYGNGNATGESATIGLQVDDSDFTRYSYDTANAVDDRTAIVFYRDRVHFALDMQSSVDLCRSSQVDVTLSRHNIDHSVNTGYTGTVTVSASGTAGTWSSVSGNGGFADLGGGRARYTFVPADRGQVVLRFAYASPVVTNFHVNDGVTTEHHVEDPFLSFRYGITGNFSDDFETGNYAGSTGTLDWSTNWVEVNESGDPGSGDTRVVLNGGNYELHLADNDGGGEGVYREFDMSGQPSGTLATLRFAYRRSGLDDANDYVGIEVSRNGGGSWTELGRITGPGTDSGEQTLSYDISAYQSANTRIRFLTSRWMGSSDRVYIDDVDITLRTPDCGIDHYAISHGGVGVSCEASSVVFTAHDDAHGLAQPGDGARLTVTAVDVVSGTTATDASWSYTGSGTFAVLGGGVASYTFADSEVGVQLWLSRPAGGSVNIDVRDSNGAVESSVEDADLAFRDTALRFYANGVADSIGSQLAGKASNVAPGAQSLSIRAVETDTETGACRSRLTGPHPVAFAYECVDPSSCVTGPTARVSGTPVPGNPAGLVSAYQTVSLNFDAAGYAPIEFVYGDAGRLVLHARADLPASVPQVAVTVDGASNPFVVAPAGLCVEAVAASADCAAGDASCSVLVAAGQSFDLAVRGVAWQTAGEQNSDFCVGNVTTPNFRLNTIGLSPQLVAPAGGSAGALGLGSVTLAAGDSGERVVPQSYTEVGVMRVTATPASYLGVGIAASASDNIGRFVPDHFTLASGALTAGCSGFTYMDQPALGLDYRVDARAAGGAITRNYRDAFAKATVGLVAEDADDGNDRGGRLSGPSATWSDGRYQVSTGNAVFGRSAGADGPFDNLAIGVRLDDNDGGISTLAGLDMQAGGSGDCIAASNCDAVRIGTTAVRYGRAALLNGHGSELQDLSLPLRAEYFQGGALGFALSGGDGCSLLGGVTLSEVDVADGLVPGETCVWDSSNLSGAACASPGSPASQFRNAAVGGMFNLVLAAPGAGNSGAVDLTVDVPDWLEFDWRGAGDADPRARATFGIFNRGSGFIYRRELR